MPNVWGRAGLTVEPEFANSPRMERVPLWRTSRTLANRSRLKILVVINRRPGMRVSDVARATRLSRPAASQYLRALEVSELVAGQRVRRSVLYEINQNTKGQPQNLAKTIVARLGKGTEIDSVFRITTAFANPGRIEVFHVLQKGPKSVAELSLATGWTNQTVLRHLRKLESRGFVRPAAEKFEAVVPDDALARCLAENAAKGL